MTKVGTGYVEIKPDFSAFGTGFDREIKAKLAGIGKSVGGDITRDVSRALGGGTSKVKVDVDRNSLSRMSAAIAGAGAQGFASVAQAATSAFSSVASTAGAIGGALTTGLGALGSLGPVLTGAGIVLGTLLLPAAIALGASLVTAAAGAAALGIALAGAFGPVALVGLAIVTRLALIVKAVASSQKASTDATNNSSQAFDGVRAAMDGVAGASQGVRSATDALSSANANLATQLQAARDAQVAATEAVKDDRLARLQAKEGIVGARLTTRQAIKDLQDFKKQAGASGDAFASVFKKFTDVHVDESGLKKALAVAAKASGTSLGADQSLELEQKIHAIREAKLGEQAATDRLHDSNVTLRQDRKTEADFLRRGAQAYGPYRDAIRQVAQAQNGLATAERGLSSARRGLAAAQRTANAEVVKQRQAFQDLTPAEQKFGTLLLATGKALKAAFSPAVAASLGGMSLAIKSGLAVLRDPQIAKSLKGIGVALGSVFATLGKEIARPETKAAFVELAAGGARLVRVFGSKVFVSLERIFLRIATAALPTLLALVDKLAGALGGLEKGTRNTDKLRGTIDTLTDSFSRVLELGHQFGRVLLEVIGGAAKSGDGLIVGLTENLRNLADHLQTTAGKKDLQNFFKQSAEFAKALGTAIIAAIPIVQALLTTFVFLVRHIRAIGIAVTAAVAIFAPEFLIAGLAVVGVIKIVQNFSKILNGIKAVARSVAGAFSAAFGAVKGAVVTALNAVVTTLTGYYQQIFDVGSHLGRGLTHGIKAGLGALAGIGKTIMNGLIDVLNTGFKTVNDFIPNRIKLPGPVPDINLPDNPLPTIPRLAAGGLTTGATFAQIGEAGQEAVLPLENTRTMARLGQAIAQQLNSAAPRLGRGFQPAAAGGSPIKIEQYITSSDPHLTAVKAGRLAMRELNAEFGRRP